VREIPVLNAYDFATYVNTAFINAYGPGTQYPYGGRPGSLTPDSIRKVMGAGTDWQAPIFRHSLLRHVRLGFSARDAPGSYPTRATGATRAGSGSADSGASRRWAAAVRSISMSGRITGPAATTPTSRARSTRALARGGTPSRPAPSSALC